MMLIMVHVLSGVKVIIFFVILVLILIIVVIFFLFFIIVLFLVDPVIAVRILCIVKVLLAAQLLTRRLHMRCNVSGRLHSHSCHNPIPRLDSGLHAHRSRRLRPSTLLVHEGASVVVLMRQLLLLEVQMCGRRRTTMVHQLLMVLLVMVIGADWLGREHSTAPLPVRRSLQHIVRVHLEQLLVVVIAWLHKHLRGILCSVLVFSAVLLDKLSDGNIIIARLGN